jgi:DNA-binding transcriptional MerR regulator
MVKSRENQAKPKGNKFISAKELMKVFGISYQTVNHYTDFGLLPLVFKKGNVRFYDRGQAKQRLSRIAKLASEGYSLRLIRKKLIGI